MSKNILLKITSAIVIAGKIAKKGDEVELPKADAEDLMHRGRAELVTASKPKAKAKTKSKVPKSELFDFTESELKELAKDADIEGFEDMDQTALVEALEAIKD